MGGGGDEGPSHIEVQFWWTLSHLKKTTYVTMITARNSGASYLNRVELMNGCISLAHSNLFILSNLNGTCFGEDGKVDPHKLKANIDTATEVYIKRVNGAPCGDGKIQFFKGADSAHKQEIRESALRYIKSSKKKKAKLVHMDPNCYSFIEEVWNIREAHAVPDLPSQYIFMLKCCHKASCPHPLCQQPAKETLWYPDGPNLDYIPLPIPDPNQQWGSSSCTKCSGFCRGYHLSPEAALLSNLPKQNKPPSTMIKEACNSLKPDESLAEATINKLARQCLLSTEEVQMWCDHLVTVKKNRKRGKQQAAATRRAKKTITGSK